jgi:hypothetical protein
MKDSATLVAELMAVICSRAADHIEALHKSAYTEGWNDREADLIAGVNRLGVPVEALSSPTEGRMREALERIKGGHFPGASNLAIAQDWWGFTNQLQLIARQALNPEEQSDV